MMFLQRVQVQHSSETNRDGKWYTLERVIDRGDKDIVDWLNERRRVFSINYKRKARVIAEIVR